MFHAECSMYGGVQPSGISSFLAATCWRRPAGRATECQLRFKFDLPMRFMSAAVSSSTDRPAVGRQWPNWQ